MIPIDGLTFFRYGNNHGIGIAIDFCFAYTQSWSNWFRDVVEISPVWLHGDTAQETKHLCSAGKDAAAWNEDIK